MLKIIILILLLGLIASLVSGAVYFYKDQGEKRRTMHALGLRVSLAVLLMVAVVYGVVSGELIMSAPWFNP